MPTKHQIAAKKRQATLARKARAAAIADIPNIVVPNPPPTSKSISKLRWESLRLIGLPEDYTPKHSISRLIRRMEEELPDNSTMMDILRISSKVEARALIDLWDNLTPAHHEYITIDHLIGAAKLDSSKVLGMITEEIHRQYGAITSIIAAVKSPGIMRARAIHATKPEGHSDAKMILQTAGVAPIPKTQTSFTTINAGQIGDRTLNMGAKAPTLEDVVGECDLDMNVETTADDLKYLPQLNKVLAAAPLTIDSVEDIEREE